MNLIIGFLVLMGITLGITVFVLRRTLFVTTENAVSRLNDEIAKANAKQAELNKKIKDANDELTKRQQEAKALADKMRADAEEETKSEREKIISKAREEGEEIISKAQGAKDKIRQEIEKQMDIKIISYSMEILNSVLSEKAKGSFNDVLIQEFLEQLKTIDMSRISSGINEVEAISLNSLSDTIKSNLQKLIEEKLNRKVTIKNTITKDMGGGLILKFGSMSLDGSIKNLIREKALVLQEKVENKKI